MEEVSRDGEYGEYSVISYNEEGEPTNPFYEDKMELIPGCTSSGIDTAKAVGATPPHRTLYDHPDYNDVRRSNVVEKCIFCEHRVKKGELPYCVEACPSGARIFGDIKNPKSEVAMLLKKHKPTVLKPGEGTKPNVYYIRDYGVRG
jgi:ferredoxin